MDTRTYIVQLLGATARLAASSKEYQIASVLAFVGAIIAQGDEKELADLLELRVKKRQESAGT